MGSGIFRNRAEDEIIARELLALVINCPGLSGPVSATLRCINALGPDSALKGHTYTASGDPDR
jgi:hypothetical protein